MSTLHRFFLFLVVLLLAAPVRAAPGLLLLDEGGESVDAWPAVTMLADPTKALTLMDVRHRAAAFQVPQVPHANFGVRQDAVWLRVPLKVSGGDGRWVLEIDYPPLNRIDLHLVSDGFPVLHRVLGNVQPFEERPLRTRAHAISLELAPGVQHEVYLRVQTSSSMLVPIRLYRADAFAQHDSIRQMLQGVLLGVTLALMAYALANGISLRDPLFALYATLLAGVMVFFISYTGIGQQFLWSAHVGLVAKIAPMSILLALIASGGFISGALQAPQVAPRTALGLRLISIVAALALLASLVDLIDYRQTQAVATALGPVPLILAWRTALVRARAGDRIARLMVLGWGAYAVGALSMAGLLRGLLAADFWTQHLFQFATLVEMMCWVRVLGLRIEAIRRAAERSELERDTLHSMAHTDALTGLPNRRGLNAALAPALAEVRQGKALAVFLLDLDGFKPVNDSFGHDAGDELLIQVGARLRSLLRHGDVVARLGGDEFVVMAPGIANEQGAHLLGRKLLDAFGEPFQVLGQRCKVGLTIGYALAPQDGQEAEALLKVADAAMYSGKQAGRHCIRGGSALAAVG